MNSLLWHCVFISSLLLWVGYASLARFFLGIDEYYIIFGSAFWFFSFGIVYREFAIPHWLIIVSPGAWYIGWKAVRAAVIGLSALVIGTLLFGEGSVNWLQFGIGILLGIPTGYITYKLSFKASADKFSKVPTYR